MSKPERQTESDAIPSELSIARREWLTTFAVAGVAAATAAIPKYASSQTRPHAANSPELELRHIKTALEPLRAANYVEEGQRRGILDTDIDDALATDINQFLGTTYQALVYSELVNALPDDVRSSNEVQTDIAEMSPVLDQALADAYFVVEAADDDIKHEIDRELRQNPDLLMDMAADLDSEGAEHGMGIYGRVRLRRASSHLSARLRMQSTHELVADVSDKINRIAERNEAKRGDGTHVEVSLGARRMLAQYDDPIVSTPSPAPLDPVVEPSSPQRAEPTASGREQRRLERKARRLKRASIGLAGAGAGLLIAGGVAYGVTAATGALVPITFGALAILLALFLLAAAVRRRKQAKEAQSKSTTAQ
jgi:hypothetical protein